MGEVYQATDTNLKREVALKVLPSSVAADAVRLARFQREAEVLAALNHPNIAQIYGLEKSDGITALVMELVDGDDLSQRIAKGAIPLDEALPIAKQIADALEAAHEQGIIHRDLKPANIKVRSDGTVKVLDFGLAKAMEPASALRASAGQAHDEVPGQSQSPTLTTPAMTQAGMILGTAAYMSPEQARGKTVDKRADIWAFGAVLYEMLTGQRAFGGEDLAVTLARVVEREPDFAALPASVPPRVAQALRVCLRKDPKQRVGDIRDVRLALDGVFESVAPPLVQGSAQRPLARRWALLVALGTASAALGAGLALWLVSPPAVPSSAGVRRFTITPSPDQPLSTSQGLWASNVAISPDGKRMVYTGRSGQRDMLFLRELGEFAVRPIPGTDGAYSPFFSPDGRQLGFVTGAALRRLPLDSSIATTVLEAPGITGGAWGADNRIVVSVRGDQAGLFTVSASGGRATRLVAPTQKGVTYWAPQVLAGGTAVMYTLLQDSGRLEEGRIIIHDLAAGTETVLLESGAFGRVVGNRYLVYSTGDDRVLSAARFNLERRALTSPAVPVLEGVMLKQGGQGAAVNASVGDDGTLVYVPARPVAPLRRIVWMSREGGVLGDAVGQPLQYARYPRLSPDERRLVLSLGTSNGAEIWVYDLADQSQPRKLTSGGHSVLPVWMKDGRILFRSGRLSADWTLESLSVDGDTRVAEKLVDGSWPSVSPDGASAMFTRSDVKTRIDLWVVSLASDQTAQPWLKTLAAEGEQEFSPDGRWVAYVSNETGLDEVWVRPFPGPGTSVRVSGDGGHTPLWSKDGGELFFVSDGPRLQSARVLSKATPIRFAPPTILFQGTFAGWFSNEGRSYDVTRDGRFLMLQEEESGNEPRIAVVLNWMEELDHLVPLS